MDKGEALNAEVAKLFADAGFSTVPTEESTEEFVVELSGGKKKPVDLLAWHDRLGVRFIGSNKAQARIKSFSDHIAGLVELKDAAGASRALLTSSEKDFDDTERNFANQRGVSLWGMSELAYFKATVAALGHFAKYEILHSIGVETNEEKLIDRVLAVKLQQPRTGTLGNPELYLFSLSADALLRTCVVLRKAQANQFAYQRILSKKRLPNIASFLESPPALLPTNLVVHLSDLVTVQKLPRKLKDGEGKDVHLPHSDQELVTLTIPLKYASLEVIDGQHRLFAFSKVKDAEIARKFNLAVLGIRGLDEEQRAETFVAINDNAKRADPSLVSYIRYKSDERTCRKNSQLMAIKIAVDLNKQDPFRNAIRLFDLSRGQKITLRGISGYDLRSLVSQQGHLRQFYTRNSSREYVRVLRIYFTVISRVLHTEWRDPKKYIVATNRGITAFLKLLRSILKAEQRRLRKRTLQKYIRALGRNWAGGWETRKLKQTYVGSQGWNRFHQDMITAIRKDRRLRNFKA
jgi:DGQHR domain-containing protein